MAINPIAPPPPKSKGGLFGKIAGAVGSIGGLAAAPFTGGASIGVGSALGGLAAMADAPKSTGGQAGPQVSRLAQATKNDPELQLATMMDSRKAAEFLPADQRDQVVPILDKAQEELKRRLALTTNRVV